MTPLDARRPRNDRSVDPWSFTHIAWGVALSLAMGPFWALLALSLWEPLEVLVLSPILGRWGIDFGHESLRNTLVDLVFNALGVLAGAWIAAAWSLAPVWTIPWP